MMLEYPSRSHTRLLGPSEQTVPAAFDHAIRLYTESAKIVQRASRESREIRAKCCQKRRLRGAKPTEWGTRKYMLRSIVAVITRSEEPCNV